MKSAGFAAMPVAGFGLLLSCSVAVASCNLAEFDRTPPTAIKDRVSNQFAEFEWASDVDQIYGRTWIWNYLTNLGSTGVGIRWDKGRINFPLFSPLPSGVTACHRYLVDVADDKPDFDAPIIYGTNSRRQDAAVYVSQTAAKKAEDSAIDASSIISTTVLDESGIVRPLDIQFSMERKGNRVQFYLYHPADVTIGIAGLALSSPQLEAATSRTGDRVAISKSLQCLLSYRVST